MSVLETFLLLFETNHDDVKKGAAEAEKTVDTLETKLKATDKATNYVKHSFMDMAKTALGFFAVAAGVHNVFEGVMAASEVSARLNDASLALNVNAADLSAWGGAVKENGGSLDGFIGSIKSLNMQMAIVDTMGKSRMTPFFKEIGIDIKKADDAMKLLPEIAGAFEKMDKGKSNAFGRRLGLDEGLILLLQQGRREVEATLNKYKEIGVITGKDAEASDKFHDSLDTLGYAFQIMYVKLGSMVLPALEKLVEKLTDFVSLIIHHGWQVEAGLIAIGIALLYLTRGAIISGLAALATAMAANLLPILAVAAAIGVAYLAIEDFIAYWNGAPSVIGVVVEKVKTLFGGLRDYLKGVWSDIKDGFSAIWNLPGNAALLGHAMTSGNTNAYQPTQQQRAAFLQSAGSKSSTVNIGEVNVQTQATDAAGISKAVGSELQRHISHAHAQATTGEW